MGEFANRWKRVDGVARASQRGRSAGEIQRWLVGELAKELDLEPSEIDTSVPVDRYGLDSRAAASLSGDLEEWLGRTLPPTLVWDYPTIEEISEHLKES
jgi:acyl carrier protein